MDPGPVPHRVGGGFVMEEQHPTHSDIHYRLGQVSGKVESLSVSIKSLEHSDEMITSNLATHYGALSAKMASINDRVTMLFTGVIISAFVLPIAIPIIGHFINNAWPPRIHQPATKP